MGSLDGRDEGVVSDGADELSSADDHGDEGSGVVSRTLPGPAISSAVRVAVSALRQGADGAHVVELSRDKSEPLRPEEV